MFCTEKKFRSEVNLILTVMDAQVSEKRPRTLGQMWKVKSDGWKLEGEGHLRWKVKDTIS